MPIGATREDVHELRAELRDEMRAEHANMSTRIRIVMRATLTSMLMGFGGLLFAIYSLLRHG